MELGGPPCGCGAVQHVGAYSVKLGYAITFVASVAGNGRCCLRMWVRQRPCFASLGLEKGKEQNLERHPTMTCRIDRIVFGPGLLILHISGQITGKDVDLLRSLLEQERSVVAIDLRNVLLVDREAIRLLALSDLNGTELRNCPAYIREWVRRERAVIIAREQGIEAGEDTEGA